jgi:rhodanese-related sulfurtransferase
LQWISPQRVHGLVKEGSALWLVDVRPPPAFEQGHIEGAVNIPYEQLKFRNLPKSKMIVLADDALGLRYARVAAEVLQNKGYEKVFIMEGGITAWEEEKLPISGARVATLRPVTLDDLQWAKSAIPHRLYDLRDDDEKTRGPVEGALHQKGSNFEERLKALLAELTPSTQKNGLAVKLERSVPIVLVLPNAQRSLDALRAAVRGIQGDIRYLEGAYPLWAAREKQNPLPGPEVCPTCPSGKKVTK